MATTRGLSLKLDEESKRLAWFISFALLAIGALWLLVDIVEENWQFSHVQGWTLIPQVLLMVAVFLLSRETQARSLVILAALLLAVVAEEYFHLATPLATRIDGWFAVPHELPYQALVVLPISAAAMIAAYAGVPRYLRPIVRNVAFALLVAWLFGGLGSVVSQMLGRPRPIQAAEEFGETAAFSIAAGYTAAVVWRLRRLERQTGAG